MVGMISGLSSLYVFVRGLYYKALFICELVVATLCVQCGTQRPLDGTHAAVQWTAVAITSTEDSFGWRHISPKDRRRCRRLGRFVRSDGRRLCNRTLFDSAPQQHPEYLCLATTNRCPKHRD